MRRGDELHAQLGYDQTAEYSSSRAVSRGRSRSHNTTQIIMRVYYCVSLVKSTHNRSYFTRGGELAALLRVPHRCFRGLVVSCGRRELLLVRTRI